MLLIVAALITGGYSLLRDLSAPVLTLAPATGTISAKRPLTITVEDAGSGLKSLQVTAAQGGRTIELLNRDYPGGTARVAETLPLTGKGLQEGPFELRLRAVDHARIRFGSGNPVEQTAALTIDSQPPQISVLTTLHILILGGAGVAVYTLSEEPAETGVKVGDRLFPAYRQPSGAYVCFFALPWNLPPAAFVPKVRAVDRAGNARTVGLYYHVTARSFPSDKVNVTPQFLESKIVPDFQQYFPETDGPLELFLKVNRDLRKENLAKVLEIGQQSAATALWAGTFLRQPNAAVPGFFAQPRTYLHNGLIIDHQTHLGIDLASTAHAPVPASNAGKVAFAADLGIYGQCVILDHGLGLQTLYGHLSQIDVKAGDTVTKGQIIGRTGTSGLAGGDHLHFDVLVSGQQVNPIEWWDPSWIKNNVTDKLLLAGVAVP
ncbi:MAG: M23 family metallopeptidase [Desulfuromonas sp.]|nr:M23 family metallopeptidase [Desulfuromonas sp.]